MKSIDFHGYTIEEALLQAEKDIYQAYCSEESIIIWITGIGPINKQLLEFVRKNALVVAVLNDGPLGLTYNGKIAVEIYREDL